MGKLVGGEYSVKINDYLKSCCEHPGIKAEMDRYEADLTAMVGRMKAAKAGNFQK